MNTLQSRNPRRYLSEGISVVLRLSFQWAALILYAGLHNLTILTLLGFLLDKKTGNDEDAV